MAEGFLALRDALRAGAASLEVGTRHLEAGVAYVRFAIANPARFRLMFSAELAERSGLPELRAASEEAFGVLLDNVRALVGPTGGEELVRTRALGAWSVVHGLSLLILDGQVAEAGTDPEAAARVARGVLIAGASGTPRPAG